MSTITQEQGMAICIIPNCRKRAASDEAFCTAHRDPVDLSAGFALGLTVCAIGVNRSGVDAGQLDYAINCKAFDHIDVREFVKILDALRASVTVTDALSRLQTNTTKQPP